MFAKIQKIVLNKFLPMFEDWEQTATDVEKKGLDVIDYINDTLGEKKYEGEHEPKAEINILRGSFE